MITDDGTPCDGKLSRTVWSGGKARGGNTRGLPIAIRADSKPGKADGNDPFQGDFGLSGPSGAEPVKGAL